MALSDSNHERRNLVITSLAFIVFYAAGGQPVDDDTVRLMVVNIKFTKPHVLVGFTWVMLVWFVVRFWQKNRGAFRTNRNSELQKLLIPESLKRVVIDQVQDSLRGTEQEQLIIDEQKTEMSRPLMYAREGVSISCNLYTENRIMVHSGQVKVVGFVGYYYRFRDHLNVYLKENAFAEYVIPYILFLGAISGPYWSDTLWLEWISTSLSVLFFT